MSTVLSQPEAEIRQRAHWTDRLAHAGLAFVGLVLRALPIRLASRFPTALRALGRE